MAFPIPGQIDDLPGRTAARDADQFGNVSFGSNRKRELSESGQRWKRRIIWLGIISVVVGLLLSSFAKPLWETYADARTQMGLRSLRDYDFDEARAHFDWLCGPIPSSVRRECCAARRSTRSRNSTRRWTT